MRYNREIVTKPSRSIVLWGSRCFFHTTEKAFYKSKNPTKKQNKKTKINKDKNKKLTNRRRKEEKTKHEFKAAQHKKAMSGVWLSRELCENPKQLPKMRTHLSAWIPVSAWPSPSLNTCCFLTAWDPSLLESSTPSLRLNYWSLLSWVYSTAGLRQLTVTVAVAI